MKLNAPKLAIAAILIALAGGSWWLSHVARVPEPPPDVKQRHDPDYIIEHFHGTIMTATGQPQFELYGKRLVHYGDDGSSTIEEPYLIQYTPGEAPTHAVAKLGYLPESMDHIRLKDNVNVSHGRDPRGAGGELRAQVLTLELDNKSSDKKPSNKK